MAEQEASVLEPLATGPGGALRDFWHPVAASAEVTDHPFRARLLETPLAIRNGETLAYLESNRPKSRGDRLQLRWQHPSEELKQQAKKDELAQYEVAALHYGYEVVGDKVSSYHFVPPSSVRGALRSWTARHLLLPGYLDALMPPPRDGVAKEKSEAQVRKLLDALRRRSSTSMRARSSETANGLTM